MEISPEGDQESLVQGWGFGELGSRQPALSDVTVPPSASLDFNKVANGNENLVDAQFDKNDRGEGANSSSGGNANNADDMMRIELESPAPSRLIRQIEREGAPPPHMTGIDVEDELPVVVLGVGYHSAEVSVPLAAVGEGQAEGETGANQPEAQGQATEAENETPCKICFINLKPQEFIYLNCGCLYCVECLNAHFRSGLANKASYPPRCCGQLPIDIEAVQGFLDDENMIRYTAVQEEFAAGRPIYCANKECDINFIGDAAQIDLQGDERLIICYGCALETCARCRELRDAHKDNEGVLECPDSLALAEVKDMAEEEEWRRCPGCGFLVEKIDGCNHMICDCRTEFHYVCGQEYGNDGRCGCSQNAGWIDDGDQDGHADGWVQPMDQDLVDLEDQLPPQVQADLHREEDFPFIFSDETGFDREEALQDIMEDTEMLLESEDEEDASAAASTTGAMREGVIARGLHQAVEDQEHEVGAVPADQMQEDNEHDEDINLHTANETLRTALAGFRNATEVLRTAAAAVVSGRRRRAVRALRGLEQADRAHGRGAGRGGGLVPEAHNNRDGEAEEQENGTEWATLAAGFEEGPELLRDLGPMIGRGRGRGGRGGGTRRGGLLLQGNEHEDGLTEDEAARAN